MNETSIPLTAPQRRGRTFLICALLFMGFLLLAPTTGVRLTGDATNDKILCVALFAVIVTLAFRGGKLWLILVKGFVGLFAAMCAILVIVVLVTLARGHALPQAPNGDNTLLSVATVVCLGFNIWALFCSKDVKDFISHQRAVASARKRQRVISRRRLSP